MVNKKDTPLFDNWNHSQESTVNINFRIKESTYKDLNKLCESTGDIISVVARRGLYKEIMRLKKGLDEESNQESRNNGV